MTFSLLDLFKTTSFNSTPCLLLSESRKSQFVLRIFVWIGRVQRDFFFDALFGFSRMLPLLDFWSKAWNLHFVFSCLLLRWFLPVTLVVSSFHKSSIPWKRMFNTKKRRKRKREKFGISFTTKRGLMVMDSAPSLTVIYGTDSPVPYKHWRSKEHMMGILSQLRVKKKKLR